MPKIKNIIIFIVIALVFFLIYIFFIKPSGEQASLVSSEAGTLPNMNGSTTDTNNPNTNTLITKDFLNLFSNVENVKLDDAIFADPAFNNLHDSSIVLIPDGTEGRKNPFAQFGNDSVSSIPALPSVPITTTNPMPTRP